MHYVSEGKDGGGSILKGVSTWCWSRRVPTSCGTSIPPRDSNA
ncbi:MAG: hypothetical protein ACLU37_02510 [Collinsella sp.]